MNDRQLAASTERLMAQVDYYLHCELDQEYDHEGPQRARGRLRAALQEELLRASTEAPAREAALQRRA
ncbi:hypothetical protein J7E62_07420 [Variovorax paradoxus]|nr:hypothetical protein [Variovorax paradoxus]